ALIAAILVLVLLNRDAL
ncbi:hypothetical protein ACMTAU_15155, partial [Alcaligenes pakistanensis]